MPCENISITAISSGVDIPIALNLEAFLYARIALLLPTLEYINLLIKLICSKRLMTRSSPSH